MRYRLSRTRPTEFRIPKGRCSGCMKPIYRGGIWYHGRFWHDSCLRKP